MKRRAFVSGLLILGGGLAGHYLTGRITGGPAAPADPKAFAAALQGVQLKYLSQELLLKIFSRQITDTDRAALISQLVNHNRNLFVQKAYDRQHGVPGFYRIIE